MCINEQKNTLHETDPNTHIFYSNHSFQNTERIFAVANKQNVTKWTEEMGKDAVLESKLN